MNRKDLKIRELENEIDNYLNENGIYSDIWNKVNEFYKNNNNESVNEKILPRVIDEILNTLDENENVNETMKYKNKRIIIPPTNDNWYLEFNVFYYYIVN